MHFRGRNAFTSRLRAWPCAGILAGVTGCHAITGLDELEGRPEAPARPTLVWARHIGGLGPQHVRALSVDSVGGIYFAGSFDGQLNLGSDTFVAGNGANGFVAKLAPNGDHLWATQLGDPIALRVEAMAVSPAGAVAVVGQFWGTLTFGLETRLSSAYDGFLATLLPDGSPGVLRTFSGEHNQSATGVCFGGEYVDVGGVFYKAVTFFDGIKTAAVEGSNLTMWFARFHRDGHLVVESPRALGDSDTQSLGAFACGEGHLYLAGTNYGSIDFPNGPTVASQGSADVFVAKLRADGDHVWSNGWGDSEKNCHDLCEVQLGVDSGGSLIISAAATGTFEFGEERHVLSPMSDVFLVKLAATGSLGQGQPVYSRSFGHDIYEQRPHALALDAQDNAYVAGLFDHSFDLGGGPLPEDDDVARDVFIASFDPMGAHRFSTSMAMISDQPDPDQHMPGGPRVAVDADGSVIIALQFRGRLEGFGSTFTSTDGDDDYDIVVMKLAFP
jgi:hypothetical protein